MLMLFENNGWHTLYLPTGKSRLLMRTVKACLALSHVEVYSFAVESPSFWTDTCRYLPCAWIGRPSISFVEMRISAKSRTLEFQL